MPKISAFSLLFLIVALVGNLAAQAQEPDATVLQLDARVTRFLDSVGADEVQAAFDELLVGSQLRKQTDAMQGLVDKAKQIENRFGQYREAEKVSAKRVGKDLILMKYLFKCDNSPVVWYFTYYRDMTRNTPLGEDEPWLLISVRFDNQLEALGT